MVKSESLIQPWCQGFPCDCGSRRPGCGAPAFQCERSCDAVLGDTATGMALGVVVIGVGTQLSCIEVKNASSVYLR